MSGFSCIELGRVISDAKLQFLNVDQKEVLSVQVSELLTAWEAMLPFESGRLNEQDKSKSVSHIWRRYQLRNETAYALELAGFETEKLHCIDVLNSPAKLQDSQMLAFPGGFSFGDEIASGKVLAIKLKEKLQDALHTYVDKGNLVLGICNGFQILVQLEILPDSSKDASRSVSLCHNSGGKFINKWVKLEVSEGSRFFRGLKSIHLPIRHGEGS